MAFMPGCQPGDPGSILGIYLIPRENPGGRIFLTFTLK